jgi:hypothetical protein
MIATHLVLTAALTVSANAPASVLPLSSYAATQAQAASPHQVLNSFARCLAQAKPDMARAVLALPTGSREQMAAAAGMLNGNDPCGPDRGEFELDIRGLGLIGGLAEGLLDVQSQTRNMATLASWNDQAIDGSGLRPRNANEDLGLCVVRRAPDETRRLLGTASGSSGEQQAVNAIVPHLGPCSPAGASLSFDRPTIRAQLAIALYRAAAFLRTAPATAAATRN